MLAAGIPAEMVVLGKTESVQWCFIKTALSCTLGRDAGAEVENLQTPKKATKKKNERFALIVRVPIYEA